MSVNSKMKAIADAIRAKTGKSGPLTLDGMASAVAGISTGAAVQRKAGSFTASAQGKASVNCGFKPDLVIVYTPVTGASGSSTREVNLKFAFTEKKTSYSELSDAEYDNGLYTGVANPTAAGFEIQMMGFSFSWSEVLSLVANKSFEYVAVKYSA